ncbi:glycosyltransferase family 2 protein [Butyrivibrio fibrisolvens]|uniref:glycosyltransferase family 2 protein n=1 Tax=Butyrivibrio fibrisolvens TaxID=831 RepID=UPI000402A0E0|nr:glycosyltransferase family 2 protein [Butyrivibrio fibrisolvens]
MNRSFDIVYVTYNSAKWIDKCFESVHNLDYPLDKINIYVVDNASGDDTIKLLENVRNKFGSDFGAFEIIHSSKNLGFGKANNMGFKKGKSDIVCFFNIDTEILSNTISQIDIAIEQSTNDVALWELRQFPYEHPKVYDPLTFEVSWASGAAFAVRRNVFGRVHGFDEGIFMYAEDVDLSWRIRSYGYKLHYVPKAVIMHYTYESAGEVKPTQFVNSLKNNLLLRYRFGSFADIIKGHFLYIARVFLPTSYLGAKPQLIKAYFQHFAKIPHFLNRRYGGRNHSFKGQFLLYDYEKIRKGAFFVNKVYEEKPLVSIIVRTCGRPEVLRETLISLRNQTYSNFEVIVVEDGEPEAKSMIEKDFADLNIRYWASGEKIGRSKAGNKAMEMASGKYLNFLDDDDLFYADHIEVLVGALNEGNVRAAYSFAFETPVVVHSKEPYRYTVYSYDEVHTQAFDKVQLCYHNYIPIQAIMFEKALFEEYGGLDESLDALEDWDLWVRYSCHTDFMCVEKTTSIYRVPRDRKINSTRQKELDEALKRVRKKHKSYNQNVSVYDLAKAYESLEHSIARIITRQK